MYTNGPEQKFRVKNSFNEMHVTSMSEVTFVMITGTVVNQRSISSFEFLIKQETKTQFHILKCDRSSNML